MLAALALAALLAAVPARAQSPMAPADLEQAVYAYADRYAMHMTAACDAIARQSVGRAAAHRASGAARKREFDLRHRHRARCVREANGSADDGDAAKLCAD
jgi:hypothetical protein